jgi:hypothetical protein
MKAAHTSICKKALHSVFNSLSAYAMMRSIHCFMGSRTCRCNRTGRSTVQMSHIEPAHVVMGSSIHPCVMGSRTALVQQSAAAAHINDSSHMRYQGTQPCTQQNPLNFMHHKQSCV